MKGKKVEIDMGYGLAERFEMVRVIDKRTCKKVFGEGEELELLVEISSGERLVRW